MIWSIYLLYAFFRYIVEGHNLTCDRLYTDAILVKQLLEEYKLTFLGTWQLSRKGFPSEIKDFSKREAPSTEIFYEVDGPLRIISYVSKGRKKKSDPTKFNKPKLTTFLTTLEPYHGKFCDLPIYWISGILAYFRLRVQLT